MPYSMSCKSKLSVSNSMLFVSLSTHELDTHHRMLNRQEEEFTELECGQITIFISTTQ